MTEVSQPDFGTRECRLCDEQPSAQIFGHHILEVHGPDAVVDWPGGVAGYFEDLKASLDQSIERSVGFPEIERNLRVSRRTIVQLAKSSGIDTN